MKKKKYYNMKKVGYEFESRLLTNTFSIFIAFFILLVLSLSFSSPDHINTILIIDFFICSILFVYKLSINIKKSIEEYINLNDED